MIINIPYLTQTTNNIKTLIIEAAILYYLIRDKYELKYVKENVPIIMFWVAMVFCTLHATGISTRAINSFVTGFSYVLLFLMIGHFATRRSLQMVVNGFFSIFLFLGIVTDLVVFITKGNGVGGYSIVKLYLLGNKFFVSYLHMLLLVLFYAQDEITLKEKRKKVVFWITLFYSAFVCNFIDCNTGIIGLLVIGVIGIFVDRRSKVCEIISRPEVYVGVFVGLSFLLVGTNVILGNVFIKQLLTRYSHTNEILTGRVDMYRIAIAAILNNPIFGDGINSTIVSDILTWGNAQNGLLKMLLDYGIVGTGFFIYVCWSSLKDCGYKLKNSLILYGMIAFLYGMAVCSMVEINLSGFYFMALAIVKTARNAR